MPQSAIPGLFECRIEYTNFLNVSGSIYNILHYLDTDSPQHDYTNQDVATLVAAAVKSFWDTIGTGGSAILRTHYDQGAPSTVYARNLNKDLVEAAAATTATGGNDTTDQLPAETSAVVSLSTAIAGRSYRGRVYMPPPAESTNAVGLISSTFVTNLKASFDSWLRPTLGNNLQIADLELVVWSRKLDVATPVVATRVNNTWDTQRGRGLR